MRDSENITTGTNFGKKKTVVDVFTWGDRFKKAPGLDAGEEAQIEAGRDLDGLQSYRGGCEDDGDGKDLLSVDHQGGWLNSVF